MGRNSLPQKFLEECKHMVKEKMMSKYINDDLQISSDDFDEKASDESGNADK